MVSGYRIDEESGFRTRRVDINCNLSTAREIAVALWHYSQHLARHNFPADSKILEAMAAEINQAIEAALKD